MLLSSAHRLRSFPQLRRRYFSTAAAAFSQSSSETPADPPPLVGLESAKLPHHPATAFHRGPIDFDIAQADVGGHVLLGRNGMGKTVLSSAIVTQGTHLKKGSFYHTADDEQQKWYSHWTAHVSFESHEALLKENCTTFKAITSGGNKLSKAAQFLVVRFGLFPLLHRNVTTLSTGEIRKVLLVRALATRPRLLVLDNAFDGLDVPSRDNLKDLVSKTLAGFRNDILVQGVDANAAARTQILLITHRAEEVVDEIQTVTCHDGQGGLLTEYRDNRSGEELLQAALGIEQEVLLADHSKLLLDDACWKDPTLPSNKQVASWWNSNRRKEGDNEDFTDHPVVHAQNLSVQRGDAILLRNLDWTVEPSERWLVAGGNGAGKSTLSRLLASNDGDGGATGELRVFGSGVGQARGHDVGWVSTELHMKMARSNKSVCDVLESDGGTDSEIVKAVSQWLDLSDPSILERRFAELSQGQQKLVLIASALASRPKLLVLDEPCQGLDLLNRKRVLGLVERICQSTDMSLIYITHHLEELLPSVTNVLHLKGGEDVYKGSREDYDPEKAAAK